MAKRTDWHHVGLAAVSTAIFVFIALPVVVVVISSLSPTQFLTFPPPGISFRHYATIFSNKEWMDSLQLSAILAALVTPLAALIGTLSAYAVIRMRFPGRDAVNTFVLSPLMVPQVMLGIALLYFFTDLGLTDTKIGLVIAHTILAVPYVVRAVAVNIYNLDEALERAAASLGATPTRIFLDITLPLIKPGVLAGAVFAAITSFGELAVTVFLSGASTTTLPVRIFAYIQNNFDPVVPAVSSIFIVIAIILLFVIDKTVGLTKLF